MDFDESHRTMYNWCNKLIVVIDCGGYVHLKNFIAFSIDVDIIFNNYFVL